MNQINADIHTVIVGASAAGLAVAACLKREGICFVLLEQSQQVAAAWRHHYDRLHLHTSKGASSLPYFPFPKAYPRYPSRDQVVSYLEMYAQHHGLQPRFGQQVTAVSQRDGKWTTVTHDTRYTSENVVIATGYTRVPNIPALPGQDSYQGEILHSSVYKNALPYVGKPVLVVGFGNSGGEIALDLVEQGARPDLSVRSPVNVIPSGALGIPILGIGILLKGVSPRVADILVAPLIRLTVGDLRKLGLQPKPYGPIQQIREEGRVPLLDNGTIQQIRAGNIHVYPGIDHLTAHSAVFSDGSQADYAAIVLATGYRPDLADFLHGAEPTLDPDGLPATSGKPTALPGLYFCGFYVSPKGMLHEIGIEAKQIADVISST